METAPNPVDPVSGESAETAGSPEDYVGSGPGKVPGAVAIGCAGGKLAVRCFGVADVATGRPMSADTIGWLASNTKAIACALVLSYVEEGKLALDEPVFRHLPEWRRAGARTGDRYRHEAM